MAKFKGVFELREVGQAALLDYPLSQGYKEIPSEMVRPIAALIVPANFPKEADFMRKEAEELEAAWAALRDNEEGHEQQMSYWEEVNQQMAALRAEGDTWGALRVQREAVDKLIGWVDPTPSPSSSIPEPNLDDMVLPRHSLLEEAYPDQEEDEEEDNFLPVGSHLLPDEFQSFLRGWNQTIAASTGGWLGEPRETYKLQNPEIWAQFSAELKRLTRLYATEVAAVKTYQASSEGKAEAATPRAV